MSDLLAHAFDDRAPLPAELFVGRHEALSALESAYHGGASSISVRGARGTGKTTLVRHFAADADRRYAYIDLSAQLDSDLSVAPTDFRQVRTLVLEVLEAQLVRYGVDSDGDLANALGAASAGTRMVVVVDEMNALGARIARRLRQYLQALPISPAPLWVWVSGFGWADPEPGVRSDRGPDDDLLLREFDRADVEALVRRINEMAMAKAGTRRFDEGAASLLHQRSHGYPVVLAAALRIALGIRKVPPGGLDTETLRQAFDDSTLVEQRKVHYCLQQAGPLAIRILKTMARTDRGAPPDALVARVEAEWRTDLRPSEVREEIQRLAHAGLVSVTPEAVHATIPLLMDWVDRMAHRDVLDVEDAPDDEAYEAVSEALALERKGRLGEAINRLSAYLDSTEDPWVNARWERARIRSDEALAAAASSEDLGETLRKAIRSLRDLRPVVHGGNRRLLDRQLLACLVQGLAQVRTSTEGSELAAWVREVDPGLEHPNARERTAVVEVAECWRELQVRDPATWRGLAIRTSANSYRWPALLSHLELQLRWMGEGRRDRGTYADNPHLQVVSTAVSDHGREFIDHFVSPLIERLPESLVPDFPWDALTLALQNLPAGTGPRIQFWLHLHERVGSARFEEATAIAQCKLFTHSVCQALHGGSSALGSSIASLFLSLPDKQMRQVWTGILEDLIDGSDHKWTPRSASAWAGFLVSVGDGASRSVARDRDVWTEACRKRFAAGRVQLDTHDTMLWTNLLGGRPDNIETVGVGITDERLASDAERVAGFLGTDWRDVEPAPELVGHRLTERSIKAFRATRADDGTPALVRLVELHGTDPGAQAVMLAALKAEQRILERLSRSATGDALPKLLAIVEPRDVEQPTRLVVSAWPGTSLRQCVDDATRASAIRKASGLWRAILNLMTSLKRLHDLNVVHWTLRPDNLAYQEGPNREARLALAHAALAVDLSDVAAGLDASGTSRPWWWRLPVDWYFAPEVIRTQLRSEIGAGGLGPASDLYGLGLTLYELLVEPLTAEDRATRWLEETTGYNSDEQSKHRRWIAARRDAIETSKLDDDAKKVLLLLLTFEPQDRPPAALDAAIDLARGLASRRTIRGLSLFAQLTGRGVPDTWTLDRQLAKLISLPDAVGARSSWLQAEFEGAQVFINARFSGEEQDDRRAPSPLLIRGARSGVLYRAARHAQYRGDRQYAFIQVAHYRDRPTGGAIATIEDVTLLDMTVAVDPEARDWNDLFEEAGAQLGHGTAPLVTALRLLVDIEYELAAQGAAFEIVERIKETNEIVIKASDPTDNLASILAHWLPAGIFFDICHARGQSVTARVALTEECLDLDQGTVLLPPTLKIPPTGTIRPESERGTRSLYNRRCQILSEVRDDQVLQRILEDVPASVRTRRTRALSPDEQIQAIPLDEDKRKLITRILATEPIFALQGPPGTGKTTLAAEVVFQVLRSDPMYRILVVTQGHEPLDNLLYRIASESSVLARLIIDQVEITRVPGNLLRRLTAEGQEAFRSDLRAQELMEHLRGWARGAHAGAAARLARELIAKDDGGAFAGADALRTRVERFGNIVFATTNSLYVEQCAPLSFDLVIIEEAARSQAVEIAGALRLAKRALLIGDHQQLPPFGSEAIQARLDGLSGGRHAANAEPENAVGRQEVDAARRHQFAFRRIHEAPGEPPNEPTHSGTLTTQWRMHPKIGTMISECFYESKSVRNPSDPTDLASLEANRSNPFPVSPLIADHAPLIWVTTPRQAGKSQASRWFAEQRIAGSLKNDGEAATVAGILSYLRTTNGTLEDVAVLSPYRRQVTEIRSRLPHKEQHLVQTADSFQGKQAGTVIVSLVRNNAVTPPAGSSSKNGEASLRHGLGFVASTQRMTVLLSRAERLLIVVGCTDQFRRFRQQSPWIHRLFGGAGYFDTTLDHTVFAKP